ncbi:NADPH-dependent FMN reductase [Gorillibacterium massiliense]|uniref:NADPH-dependent FMN reductase n=1 Tax=Gorillibacterium massiliense TaxID=1280390 RepID=UPI0004B60DB2|nr:NADPH-dependent FMN reductase [Gorillibacterium massiliense]
MPQVLLISGNPSKSSRMNGLTYYCHQALLKSGLSVSVLHVIDLPAASLLSADFGDPAIQAALTQVAQADAVIIASPVYKASYSGLLKVFLDMLPQKGLQDKIIFPLFIGGSLAHLLVIEYALKPVLSVLGGTNILQGVYAVDQWVTRLEGGGFELTAELQARLDQTVQRFALEIGRQQLSASSTDTVAAE